MEEVKTLTINELIETLRQIKIDLQGEIENVGYMKVFLSSDSEGNSFGTLERGNAMASFDVVRRDDSNYGNVLIIYPWQEGIDIFNFEE